LRLIVDSDGAIDDAAALLWLCANPDIDIVAVTAVGGSVPAEQAAVNLRVILEAAGADAVPVFVGSDPSGPAPRTRRPVMIHGHDGLADVRRPAARRPPETSRSATEALAEYCRDGIDVLALGPMTNLAVAIASGAMRSAEARLTFMGGSATAGGNARPLAEANIAHDPAAADAVLRAPWAEPPLMVGLDVTHAATFTEHEFAALMARQTPAAEFLADRLAFYQRNAGLLCSPGETPCHDLLAAMACIDPALLVSELLDVQVDVGGSSAWGATVVDMRPLARRVHIRPGGEEEGNAPGDGTPVRVALEADVDRFRSNVRDFFLKS
jgi:inosine-uridine nucleoside N-ribohydrolase